MNLVASIELQLPAGFTVQERLGTGGTSAVYRAVCARTGRELAVKVMKPGSVTPESVDRFLREMQLLKRLHHPRIVPLLEPGEARGALFFTMPFIEGESLRELLQRGEPLPVASALRITLDIADALVYVHAQGVVHRDIKPENILMDRTGEAFLIDFGFARSIRLPAIGGGERVVVGTPAYMSPEQVSGLPEDARSDLYSPACVLYEMLTNRQPFAGDSHRALMNVRLRAECPDVRLIRGDLPSEVATLLDRSMTASPSNRIATAGEFYECVRDALAQTSGLAAPQWSDRTLSDG